MDTPQPQHPPPQIANINACMGVGRWYPTKTQKKLQVFRRHNNNNKRNDKIKHIHTPKKRNISAQRTRKRLSSRLGATKAYFWVTRT